MTQIKMTKTDEENKRLAGLVYLVTDKEAAQYIADGVAVPVEDPKQEKPKKEKVKHGDG